MYLKKNRSLKYNFHHNILGQHASMVYLVFNLFSPGNNIHTCVIQDELFLRAIHTEHTNGRGLNPVSMSLVYTIISCGPFLRSGNGKVKLQSRVPVISGQQRRAVIQ